MTQDVRRSAGGVDPRLFTYENVRPDLDLGTTEFDLTEEDFDHYRLATENPEGFWVFNTVRPTSFLMDKLGWSHPPGRPPIHARTNAEFFDRPRPGTMTVSGRVIDRYIRRDKPYIVAEYVTRTSTGSTIERLQRTLMTSAPTVGERMVSSRRSRKAPAAPALTTKRARADIEVGVGAHPVVKHLTFDVMQRFEGRLATDHRANVHSSEDVARQAGLPQPIASAHHTLSYVHELMNTFLGQDWVFGGKVDIRFLYPVVANDTLTVRGVVGEKQSAAGKVRLLLDIWAENQNRELIAIGQASGFVA